MKTTLSKMAGFTFLLLIGQSVWAEIYRYTDEAGRVVYTNVPPKTQKNLHLVTEQISVIPSGYLSRTLLPAPSNSSVKNETKSDTSTATTNTMVATQIDSSTQKNRDTTRKGILLEELNTEIKALTDAKKQKSQAIGATVEAAIQSHERNINALQKELSLH